MKLVPGVMKDTLPAARCPLEIKTKRSALNLAIFRPLFNSRRLWVCLLAIAVKMDKGE